MRRFATFLGKVLIKPGKGKMPAHPKKILIIRSGGLGDVLMTTPLVRATRKRYPKAKITYLVGRWAAAALRHNPNVDRVWEFDDAIAFKKNVFAVRKLIKELRKENFELCFILDKSYHWNMVAYLAKIPFRIGFDRHGEGFPNNLNVPFDGSKYELEYYIDVVRLANAKAGRGIELYSTAKDRKVAESFVKPMKGKILIGVAAGGAQNPGQAFHEKRWPVEKYIGLINVLAENDKVVFILFGGKSDDSLNRHIIEKSLRKKQVINAAHLSLHEAFEAMKRCRLIVTHDSGALHMAGAARVKLIALFGPTPAERFAPRNALVIKSPAAGCPCYDEYGRYDKRFAPSCMETISVDTVYQAVKNMVKL
ncbi:glycosyltransferase family 9 protein [Candidatus Woesearchaeota archaeon]|nr:glycosyltransferase family 9 protein [Candidatus Woesearchaeota archaeon]